MLRDHSRKIMKICNCTSVLILECYPYGLILYSNKLINENFNILVKHINNNVIRCNLKIIYDLEYVIKQKKKKI